MTDAPKPGAEPLNDEELASIEAFVNTPWLAYPESAMPMARRLLATIAALKEQVADLTSEANAYADEITALKGRGDNVEPDTGHPEADRLIARLMSSDPDFDDCTDASVLIRQLVVEHKGPDDFATWKDAALAERLEKAALQKEVAELKGALSGTTPPDGLVEALNHSAVRAALTAHRGDKTQAIGAGKE